MDSRLIIQGGLPNQEEFNFAVAPYGGVDNAHAAFDAAFRTWTGLMGDRDGSGAVQTAVLHFGNTALEVFSRQTGAGHALVANDALDHHLVVPVPAEGDGMPPGAIPTGWITGWNDASIHADMAVQPAVRSMAKGLDASIRREFAWLDLRTGDVRTETVVVHPLEPDCAETPGKVHRWRRMHPDQQVEASPPWRTLPGTVLECCIDCGLAKADHNSESMRQDRTLRYWKLPESVRAGLNERATAGMPETAPAPARELIVCHGHSGWPLATGADGAKPRPFRGVGDAMQVLAEALAPDGGLAAGRIYAAMTKPLGSAVWQDRVVAWGGRDAATGRVAVQAGLSATERYAWHDLSAQYLMHPQFDPAAGAADIDDLVCGLQQAMRRQAGIGGRSPAPVDAAVCDLLTGEVIALPHLSAETEPPNRGRTCCRRVRGTMAANSSGKPRAMLPQSVTVAQHSTPSDAFCIVVGKPAEPDAADIQLPIEFEFRGIEYALEQVRQGVQAALPTHNHPGHSCRIANGRPFWF